MRETRQVYLLLAVVIWLGLDNSRPGAVLVRGGDGNRECAGAGLYRRVVGPLGLESSQRQSGKPRGVSGNGKAESESEKQSIQQ